MAAALGSIGDPQAVDTLLEVVAAETDDVARVQLVIALAELGDSDAVEPLTALIEPEDKPSRRLVDVVVGALGSLGDRRPWGEAVARQVEACSLELQVVNLAGC